MLAGPEPSNTSSNGRDTQKQTTPGNQLTRFTLHNSLKPITDRTRSKLKGDEPAQDQSFASFLPFNVCRRINPSKRRAAPVGQTPFSSTTFEPAESARPSRHHPHPPRPRDTRTPCTRSSP